MLRKLAAAIAIAGSVGSPFGAGAAYGLGLGEIKLNSALNQPLNAEIELVEMGGLTAGEVLSTMATREDFSRAGVDRPYFLSGLRFQTVTRADGTAFVRVTSPKPVVEPYLNFLVEVHWPSGRLLREYTLLLDPPSFSHSVVEEVTERPAVPAKKTKPEPPVKKDAKSPLAIPEAASTPSSSMASVASVAAEGVPGTYRVKRNDTLWEVALNTRPGRDVSPVKMMAALQTENPRAFINGNINLLKQGSVLKIPDRTMIESLNAADANRAVTQQNRQWKEGSSQVQLDATRKSEVADTARGTVDNDRLSIVSASAADSAEDGADQGDGKSGGSARALKDAVAINQEQLDTLSRENTDLKDRLRELEDQISSLEKLVVLRSDELVATQLTAQQDQQAGNDALMPEQSKAAQSDDVTAQEEVDYNFQETEAAAPVKPAEAEPARPAPVVQQPVQPKGIIDTLLNNPFYLAAAGGGIALLGLLALLLRRRQKDAAEEGLDEELYADDDQIKHDFETMLADEELETALDGQDVESGDENDINDQELEIDPDLLDESATDDVVTDPLGEAEIYIAYSNFEEASTVLERGVEAEPERSDLRIKLMEVCVETGNAALFAEQKTALKVMGSSEGLNRANELQSGFAEGDIEEAEAALKTQGEEVSVRDDEMLDEIIEPFVTAESEELDDLEFDLSDVELSDDLNLSSSEEAEAGQSEASEAGEFDLEFDNLEMEGLELDEVDELKGVELDGLELGDEIVDQEAKSQEAVEDVQPEVSNLDSDFESDLEGLELGGVEQEVDADEPSPVVEAQATDAEPNIDSELAELDAELEGLSADINMDEFAEVMARETTGDSASGSELVQPESAEFDEVSLESPADELSSEAVGEPARAIDDSADQPSVADASSEEQLDVGLSNLAGVNMPDSLGIDDMETEFSFLEDTDETATKLDLARAYMEMGDEEGARDILDEVVKEGSREQKEEAQGLIDKIS